MAVQKIRKILLPTDGSIYSLKAAEYAAELAMMGNRKVTVLHVMEVTPVVDQPIEVGADARIAIEHEDLIRERGKRAVEETKKIFAQAGIPVETKYFYGHTIRAIIETAQKEGFDLIVMGSRGIGGVKLLLLGSVAEGVSRQAPCPVLIVR